MKRLLTASFALIALPILGAARSPAQSMDDLNLQIHGYATQGFIYSTHNNWNTSDSTDGSAAWTEAVVNLTALPQPRLRIGVQARYFMLGNYGNTITLDWAQADYKVNEKAGFRAGKVKTPLGLLNDTQDIDPAHLWILLPQSVYPLSSRNSILAHYGAVVYGTLELGESLGKVEYRVFGGSRVLGGDDGYFQSFRDAGLTLPNGLTSPLAGAALKWHAPIQGLEFGASNSFEHPSGRIVAGPMQGNLQSSRLIIPYFFASYDRGRLMAAAEYNRIYINSTTQFPGVPAIRLRIDQRTFYVMSSYKLSEKLSGGVYYSSSIDSQAAFTSSRHQKDWALSARYDCNPFLYLKLEQHFIDGTELGYSISDNGGGLNPDSRMTLLLLGVSFR